jgi:ribosomal protein S13
MPGFGTFFKKKYSERFELTFFLKDKKRTLVNYQNETIRSITKPTNIIFSQINSVNNQRPELYYLNIIRLYLIKTYRGRCHALGKPVRGQRT